MHTRSDARTRSGRFPRSLGVLGGLGPRATALALDRVVDAAHRRGARDNHEFPRVVVTSCPAHDVFASDEHREATRRGLVHEAEGLRASGAEVLVVACNAVHAFLDDLRGVGGEWVSLVDVGCASVRAAGVKEVALLGTRVASRWRVYHPALERLGVRVREPGAEAQRALDRTIGALLGGRPEASLRRVVEDVARDLVDAGADGVVLACTELSLLVPLTSSAPVFDPLALAIEDAVGRCAQPEVVAP